MLDTTSPMYAHVAQNLSLILLSVVFLPLDSIVLALTFAYSAIFPSYDVCKRQRIRKSPGFKPHRILVTGVGMSKGLALARTFYKAGHDVVGADFERGLALACGRQSRALTKFYKLQSPSEANASEAYIQSLQDIVTNESIDLWVSCSGVVSAVDDGRAKEAIERNTRCTAIQFDAKTTEILHEKNSFMELVSKIGLNVPETHTVASLEGACKRLENESSGRRYIIKPIGVDDASRGDMTLLPLASKTETVEHLKRTSISENKPWLLQQYINGSEYCSHALVVKGQVAAFVACPSSELLMHYEALPPDSSLSEKMLEFTKCVANYWGGSFTGHLSFDFLVEAQADPHNVELYPIECNPRCHTAVVLFNGSSIALTKAYASALDHSSFGSDEYVRTIHPQTPRRYHWIGHDLVTMLLLPLVDGLMGVTTRENLYTRLERFLRMLLYSKDGTFEVWDPLPWWWLYHVYWPMTFIVSIWKMEAWSRINVSTTKMFKCG